MIYIALGYSLIFILFFILLQLFPRYTVSSKVYRNGLIILIFMFCYIAYRYIPLKTDDLYRYYLLIDRMRNRSLEWGMFSSSYAHEPFSNFLFICVAKITKSNVLYQIIAVMLIYGMFFINIKKTTNFIIKKEENLYIITFLSFMILRFSISGTRNTMAALFFAYGLYSEDDKISKKSWVFYILSVCTHIGLLPVVVIRLLANYLPKKRFYFIHFILIFWSLSVGPILKLFYHIKNSYVQLFLWKIQKYTYNMYNQEIDIRYLIAMLVLCILLALIYLVESKSGNSYINFMGYLIFMTLGCFVSPVLFERFIRVVCACMLPMLIDLKKEKWAIKKLVMYVIVVLDIGMLCYQTWMFIYHFNVWFV